MKTLRLTLAHNAGPLAALSIFILMFVIYIAFHPAGFTSAVVTTATNKAVLLALVAMAQTLPVLTGGIDMSVGVIFVLTNCLASRLVVGTVPEALLGIVAVLLAGSLAGLVNGLIVVAGRLQPMITTLASGAVFAGIALWIRPSPGGDIQSDIADFATGTLFDTIPVGLLLLAAVVLAVWVPFRRSEYGRAALAIGSNENAAYVSGVPTHQAKTLVYVLSGLLAAIGGILLTCNTYSGEASATVAGAYTLNSIASVVIGGTSLAGGWGTAIGSVFGAFILRTIEDLLFVFDLPPLWQPLFQGTVLLLAISVGAIRVFRVKNRLEIFQ
jgi:ribose transport system permease protein